MKTVVIIPSRYGSSRFNGKPLAPIHGIPMIQHVYQRTLSAQCVDEVYVATDDERIFQAVQGFGGRVLMTSAALRSGTDRAAEAADLLGLASGDIVINVQGDQPLIDPRCLDEVVRPLHDDTNVGMTTLAFRIVDHREYANPKDCKVVMDEAGRALYFSRAAIPLVRDGNADGVAFKHLGIYAYRVSFLVCFSGLPAGRLENLEKLEQLRALEYGHPIHVVVTRHDSPEVDLPEDIAWIEAKMDTI